MNAMMSNLRVHIQEKNNNSGNIYKWQNAADVSKHHSAYKLVITHKIGYNVLLGSVECWSL